MGKKIYSVFAIFTFVFQLQAQMVSIIESEGWLESAFVKWTPIDTAISYQVFYSGKGITNKSIDNQLIRTYPDYIRADVMGIEAGTYTLKVLPVFQNSVGDTTTIENINVLTYDRSGFAFSGDRIPGAYKANGTLKDNAVVIYITENSKNKVNLNVSGANANPCVGLQTILDGFKKGEDTRPLVIRMVGQITDPDYLLKGDVVIENNQNASGYITLEGVGEDAVADGWGIRLKNASNIEIRNIGTMNCNSDEGDNIGLQQDNDHIWVHHNDFFYGDAGTDSDQAKGDGALDCKESTYVTISYNHFWDSGKSNLLGNGGETMGYFTYHHNWYDHSDSRHPRVREHTVHVFNNYFDGNAKYGIGATTACSIFAENNYFRNCKYPMLISEQGTDVYGSNDGTFSGDPGGMIKAFGNYMEGETRFVDQTDFPTDFDAYVTASADETIPSTITTVSGGNTYNNFDTNTSLMYNYDVDSPTAARDKVTLYAGRVSGGDFKWTFDNSVDDASYDVNVALKLALASYTTKLLSIQGDSISGGGGDDDPPTEGDEIHNFTTDGLASTFYTITGNLSTSYGTVNYGDLTLTQCLKIESSTSITFNTTRAGTLTLVFNASNSSNIKVDGTTYEYSTNVFEIDLEAGSHSITKASSAYLFYMSMVYENSGSQYVLTLNTVGSGTVTGAGTYDAGSSVPISATPDAGWKFNGWTGDTTSSEPNLSITLNSNLNLIANFVEIQDDVQEQAFSNIQTYPNPFNESTTISFTLNSRQNISYVVFDLSGRIIDQMQATSYNAGEVSQQYVKADLKAGIYMMTIRIGNEKQHIRLVVN